MTELANLNAILPEIVIVIGAMTLLMAGAFWPNRVTHGVDESAPKGKPERDESALSWVAILVLVLACGLVVLLPADGQHVFGGSLVVDAFGQFMKVLVLIAAIAGLLLSFDFLQGKGLAKFEYPVLVLLSCTGMLLMISANDLISLYLALELQSLPLYVLAAYHRDNLRSSEAGLKYFVLGALSSGMLLYGASLVYGFTGATGFEQIAKVPAMHDIVQNGVHQSILNVGLMFGLVFILVGLAFKISAVPFHMWTPDVYEGAPTPVTAFFAAAPKLAAMALLIRVLTGAFPALSSQWQQIIIFISIASMVLGAFAAIGQNNIKRLMAYSSIGHVGFALVGIAANSQAGTQATLIYLAIYLAMTLGAFAGILAMRRNDLLVEDIDELSGLAQNNLPMAFAIAVLMFSLAGLPPLAGFVGKLYVFQAVLAEDGLYPLAIIGVLASVVAAYYYLRIVKVMFFDEPKEKFAPVYGKLGLVMVAAVVFIIGFMIVPSPLVSWALDASKSLQLLR